MDARRRGAVLKRKRSSLACLEAPFPEPWPGPATDEVMEEAPLIPVQADQTSLADSGEGSAGSRGSHGREKSCPGCRMQFGEPELLQEDGVVTRYHAGSRGVFCTKCFRNHRTCMSNEMGLSLLEEWLANPAHRLEWNRRLIASLVLRKTCALKKVTFADVVIFIDQWKTMSNLLGLPTSPFEVCPLTDFGTDGVRAGEVFSASQLVQVCGRQGYELGVAVPMTLPTDAEMMPLPPSNSPCLRPWLRAPRDEDTALLSELLQSEKLMDPLAQPPSSSCTDIVTHGVKQSRLETKLSFIIQKLRNTLETLGSKDWHVTVKESVLRPWMLKLQVTTSEAKSCGNASALELSEKWLLGTQAVKDSLAKHREFTRSGRKGRSDKYVALHEVISLAVTFLDDVGVPLADSFRLLAWKAALVATAKSSLPLEDTVVAGLDGLLELQVTSGLALALLRETKASGFSAELWLEDLAEECLVPLLTPICKGDAPSWDGPRLEQYRRRWETVTSRLANIFTDISSLMGMAFEEHGGLTKNLSTYFAAVAEDSDGAVSPTELKDAALFIEARLPQATWAAWKSSPVLEPLHSRAQAAMALGAQDLLGDERFDAADFYLGNAKLPKFQVHEDRVQLDWEKADVAVVCVRLVQDSVDACAEALELWSAMRSSERSNALVEWASKLGRTLAALDLSMSVEAFLVAEDVRVLCEEDVELTALQAVLEKASAVIAGRHEHEIGVEPVVAVLRAICKVCLGPHHRQILGHVLDGVLPAIEDNKARRKDATLALRCLKRLASVKMPSNCEAAIQEFAAHAWEGSEASFLGMLSGYRAHSLRGSVLGFYNAPMDLKVQLLVGRKLHNAFDGETTLGDIHACFRTLESLPPIHALAGMLTQSQQIVYERFAASLHIDDIKVCAEARDRGDAARDTAEGLVSVQALADCVEAIRQGARGETLKLPPQRYLELLTSMLHGSYNDTDIFPFDPTPVAQSKCHIPIGVLKQWWRLHVDYVNIVAAVAFLETSFAKAESAVDENKLPHWAFRLVCKHAAQAMSRVAVVRQCLPCADGWAPAWSTVETITWDKDVKSWLDVKALNVFEECAKRVIEEAEILSAKLPSTETFLTEELIVPTAARKALLQNKARRAQIAEGAASLFDLIDRVVSCWQDLGYTDQTLFESCPLLQEANVISAAADRLVDITACLSVVYEKNGPLQATAAQTVLSASPAVPTPLLRLVQELAVASTSSEKPQPKKRPRT